MTPSPAFQVYVNDFLGSAKVGMMTTEEVGAYWLLLCLDWQEQGFIYEERDLSKWCRLTRSRFVRAWERVGKCFVEEDGRWYNPRLQAERAKQVAWRDKAATGAAITNEKRWGKGRNSDRPSDRSSDEIATADESLPGRTPLPSSTPTSLTTKPSPRAADAERATWLTPYLDAWAAAYGGQIKPGRLAAALSPVHKQHGDAETIRRWRVYLGATAAEFANPVKFSETFGRWDGTTKLQNGTPRAPQAEAAGAVFASVLALIRSTPVPGQAAARHIRPADVDELGPAVRAAYDAVGGSSRFLAAEGDKIGYLLRDFEKAYTVP